MDNTKLINPVEIALRMENDGRDFYLESSQKASNKLVKEMLISLAKDEEKHICIFEKIYESIKNRSIWPEDVFVVSEQNLKSVFEIHKDENIKKVQDAKIDLDIIRMAQDIENESYEYYRDLAANLLESKIKKFFEKIAKIEGHHYDMLLNTYEYLDSQIDWFTKEEKPSFEG